MVHCCVLGCRNRSERRSKNITFHSFPKDLTNRSRWINFTGRKNWRPSKHGRLCSSHFEGSCFYKTKYKVYLQNYALPTLCKHEIVPMRLRNNQVICNNNADMALLSPVITLKEGPKPDLSSDKARENLYKKSKVHATVLGNYGLLETSIRRVTKKKESQDGESEMEEITENDEQRIEEKKDVQVGMELKLEEMNIPLHPNYTMGELLLSGKSTELIEVPIEYEVEENIDRIQAATLKSLSLLSSAVGEPIPQTVNEKETSVSLLKKRLEGARPNIKEGKLLVERFYSDMDLLKHVQDAKVQNAKNGLASEKVKTDDMENETIMEKEYTGADQFKWKPLNGWHGVKNPFLKEYSGPTAAFTNSYDTFRAYWDDNALSHIAAQTNAYSSQFRDKFYKDWINTNADEIMILFAFWIMLGILKMPTIKACYSEVNVIRTDIFRRLMTENRYVNLNKFFYVNQLNGKDSDSFLINFETLIDHLNLKFKELYNLEQEVSVDESSNLWKFENCDDKTLSSRIKIPLLCESSSTYIWSFLVDINREQNARKPRPDEYVRKLMQPILNCGHTLYTDSCYTCPMLARYFKQNRTNFAGKVISTKNVPLIIRNAVLNEGEFVARQSGDVMLVAFQGEKREYYLSTCHGAVQIHDSGSGESGQYKLLVINEYNRGIKQIGQIDYCTEPYLQRKDVKWEIKLFKTLLNMSIHNSQILLEKSMNLKVSSLAFRLSLVQAIIDKHLNKVPKQKSTIEFPMERLTERHFIRRISIARNDTGQNIINSQMCIRKTCVWCSRKGRDRKTAFECPNCNVALCIDCFELFHTTFG